MSLGTVRVGDVVSLPPGAGSDDVAPPVVLVVLLLVLVDGVVAVVGGGVEVVPGVVVIAVVVDDDEDVAAPPPVSVVPVPVVVVVSVTCDDVTVGAGDVVMSTLAGVYAVCCGFNIIWLQVCVPEGSCAHSRAFWISVVIGAITVIGIIITAVSSIPPIRLLPPVVGGNEVVGAVIVGAEEDDEDDGDENGDEDVVVPEAVVSVVVAAVFCVKSIVRRTGWHISAAGVPTSIADAHNSKLLTLAGIVTLIGRLIGASFPRIRLTSMPIFLVERLLLVAVPPSGSPASAPSSPILNVNVSGLVPPPVIVALWSVVVFVAPVCCWAIANDEENPANKIAARSKGIKPNNTGQLSHMLADKLILKQLCCVIAAHRVLLLKKKAKNNFVWNSNRNSQNRHKGSMTLQTYRWLKNWAHNSREKRTTGI
jgi:hypothetical protein